MSGKPVSAPTQVMLGPALVDFELREVRRDGTATRLEPRAAEVLRLLVEGEGRVLSRSELLDACWPGEAGSDEALTQTVAQIRRALGDDSRSPVYLQTIPKAGYRIIAETGPVEKGGTDEDDGDAEASAAIGTLIPRPVPAAIVPDAGFSRRPTHFGLLLLIVITAVLSVAITLSLASPRVYKKEIVVLKRADGPGSPTS